MRSHISAAQAPHSVVPVSRFYKGEAERIFDEVADAGVKIVVNNNEPTCLLLSPKRYDEIMEEVADVYLIAETERRMADDSGVCYSHEEIMARHNITQADLDAVPEEDLELA